MGKRLSLVLLVLEALLLRVAGPSNLTHVRRPRRRPPPLARPVRSFRAMECVGEQRVKAALRRCRMAGVLLKRAAACVS